MHFCSCRAHALAHGRAQRSATQEWRGATLPKAQAKHKRSKWPSRVQRRREPLLRHLLCQLLQGRLAIREDGGHVGGLQTHRQSQKWMQGCL